MFSTDPTEQVSFILLSNDKVRNNQKLNREKKKKQSVRDLLGESSMEGVERIFEIYEEIFESQQIFDGSIFTTSVKQGAVCFSSFFFPFLHLMNSRSSSSSSSSSKKKKKKKKKNIKNKKG